MPHRFARFVAAALALPLALAAMSRSEAQDLKAAVMAQDSAFSAGISAADVNAVAAIYSADGEILPPGADAVKGTAAIAVFLQGILKEGIGSITLTTLEVVGQGRYATEVGRYLMKDKSGKEIDHGKFLELWRREKGGWKLYRDIFNSSVAQKN